MIVERYSANKKLGGMGATYRPVWKTCPQSCPLLGNGCYAQRGLVDLHQRNAAKRNDSLDELCGLDMVRHLVSGDAFYRTPAGLSKLDRVFVQRVLNWHRKNPRTSGALYTHDAERWSAAGFTPEAIPPNLSVIASCDSPRKRRILRELGWRTARVIRRPEDAQEGEILCPYDRARHYRQRPNPHSCRNCRLCWPGHSCDIAFVQFGRANGGPF